MSGKPKVIKYRNIPRTKFDAKLSLTEARNAERLFALHLKRCDEPNAAEALAEIFLSLGESFSQKKVALCK